MSKRDDMSMLSKRWDQAKADRREASKLTHERVAARFALMGFTLHYDKTYWVWGVVDPEGVVGYEIYQSRYKAMLATLNEYKVKLT